MGVVMGNWWLFVTSEVLLMSCRLPVCLIVCGFVDRTLPHFPAGALYPAGNEGVDGWVMGG